MQVRAELQWDVPMCVSLPIEILNPELVFPFLECTLTDLGIPPCAVQERLVWLDTKRTQVRKPAGKLKEKEIWVLEVRVKGQRVEDGRIQEILYSTQSHTNRSLCCSMVTIQPWINTHAHTDDPTEEILPPFEITLPLDVAQMPTGLPTEHN